jgi:hypothetical protein
MTRPAIRFSVFKGRRKMAFLAFGLHMFACQWKLGLTMVKFRLGPGLLIMAGFAFLTFLAFVFVIFFMARNTRDLQLVLVYISLMATGALYRREVLAEQRIFSFLVVVKQDFSPTLFKVAGFTFRPKVALVFVILGVAGITSHLQLVLVHIALMTGNTLGFNVIPLQNIFSLLVMIKNSLSPDFFHVASFTFQTIVTLVLVIILVAGLASHLQLVFIQVAFVAAAAFCLFVLTDEWIFGFLVMIKQDIFPAPLGVARFTLLSKTALVLVIFLVTGITLRGRIFKFVLNVATDAFHIFMFEMQWVLGFVVIKAGGFPAFFHVALRTIGS